MLNVSHSTEQLRNRLKSANVIEVNPTRLSNDKIRVRLDLAKNVDETFGSISFGKVKNLVQTAAQGDQSAIAQIGKEVCDIISQNLNDGCPSSANFLITGLVGVNPLMDKKTFSTLKTSQLN